MIHHLSSPRLLIAAVALVLPSLVVAAEAPVEGYRTDLVRDLEILETKIVGLAGAIPADKYTWSPSQEVRTVSQALMHVAAANYFFPTLLGLAMPEDIDVSSLEKTTDKDAVVAALESSFARMREMVTSVGEDQLADSLKLFGQDATKAGALHFAVSHCHEHLGQLIAYARSLGVVPPWSAGSQD